MLLGFPSFGYQSKIGAGKNHPKGPKTIGDTHPAQSAADLAKKSPST
jgi:hypothetical protein